MLTELKLHEFRCFGSLELAPGPERTFITGANAQGKTSILEAICVLLRLQSPRTSSLAEAVRIGGTGFHLDGRFSDAHLSCRYSDGLRSIALDSKTQSRTDDYLDVARVAWFANADLELVRGSGGNRRRYLDFLGMQCIPGYRKALRAYERALRSRNALLKDGRPRREVAAFDAPLVESGEFLVASRESLISALAPLAGSACTDISGGGDRLEITYVPGASLPLAEALAAARQEEERLRLTVTGPHRDDLHIRINGLQAAGFSSEGQQRGIALALKLAQARHIEAVQQRAPVLLIDDVFGELDPGRRNRLLGSLPSGAQAVITTTFLDWTEASPQDRHLQLAGGNLVEAR